MEKLKTKNFGKSEISLELPDLLQVQHENWELLWEKDMNELFEETFPMKDYTGKKYELRYIDYKLGKPKYDTPDEARANNDTYQAPLRVKVELVDLKSGESKKEEVFFADFPLMTPKASFVVNGVERVIISQLIRSPGAFFNSQTSRGEVCFGAKIIPNRGSWLEFKTDSTGFIGVKIDRKRKVPVTTLLRAFGYEKDEEIKKLFKDVDKGETKMIEKTLEKDSTNNQVEAFVKIYQTLRPGDRATEDTAKELFENMFYNFKRYDLSTVGRWRMWQRLPELEKSQGKDVDKVTTEDRTLKPEDVKAVVREIIRMNNDPDAEEDEIDHLGNRRVRTLNELIKDRLRVGLMRLERNIKDRLSTIDPENFTPSKIINARPFMGVVQRFFASSPLCQFMDNENPLAELEQKRRLTAGGPGGLTKERAGFDVRDVQPSHYGRICPIQTPEGPNVGLVGHLASFSKVNKLGFLETPYFKVKNKKVQIKKGSNPPAEVEYLNAHQEEKVNIAAGTVPINKKGKITADRVEAREHSEPAIVDPKEINYLDVSPEQAISIATSCIPFLQNDDANRALMGSNMQRQAVPLVNPDPPLVMTGVEDNIVRDSGQEIVAKFDGTIEEVDGNHIKIKPKAKNKESKTYNLRTFVGGNQYTCFHQKPRVEKGEKVKKGDVLTDGGAVKKGHMALGKNAMVAFIPWRGGNFEDAIVISEKLVKEDAFTSIHIEEFTCDVRETKRGPEVTTSDIPNVSQEKLKDLNEDGIIRIGAEIEPNDILVGKISPKGETDLTAEERLLKAIFGKKAKNVKDTSLRLEHGKRGRVVGIKVFSREKGHKLDPGVIKKVQVEVAVMRKIQAGDKLAGRHGNKGVISKVLPEEEMPFLEDGTPVDVILNPLGVVSRMNIGQILETHLGWAAKEQGYHAISPGLAGATEEDIKEELKKAGLPENGKVTLYDGKTGEKFPRKITVGPMYIMKLIHMVEDKIHTRAIGNYSLITQQPLGGKSQFGGQRFGEMEVWALEGYGSAYTLQEMLTIKSDDIRGRANAYKSILQGEEIDKPNIPASFHLLTNEMKALGLNINIETSDEEIEEEEEEA